MNTLAKIGVGIFAVIIAVSMFSQCGRNREARIYQEPGNQVSSYQEPRTTQETRSTEAIMLEYAKGFDLAAATALAKKAKDAADFERLLNSPSEAVNNIDLNDDGKVDYIKVTEYGSGNTRGFSLTDEISPGKIQEIATIEFQKETNASAATVQTTGNPSLYGASHYHHSSFGLTDALLVGWMFSNRPTYTSPYGYGNYPPYYGGGWSRQDDDSYAGSMRSRNAGSTIQSSSRPVISNPPASPNADKMAAKAKVLTNPTQSQRSFSSQGSGGSSGTNSASRPSSGSSSSRPSSGSTTSPSKPSSGSTTSPSRPSSGSTSSPSKPSSSGGFGRSSSSGSSRSGSSSRGGK